jgi:hypothetical protein
MNMAKSMFEITNSTRITRIRQYHLTLAKNINTVLKCYTCNKELKLNDLVISSRSFPSVDAQFKRKYRHLECALMKNIITEE